MALHSGTGSNAPNTVVPAVSPIKKGVWPCFMLCSTAFLSAIGLSRPWSSEATAIKFSVPMPSTLAAF